MDAANDVVSRSGLTVKAEGIKLSDMPELVSLVEALSKPQQMLLMSMLRIDNIAAGFNGIVTAFPELESAFTALFSMCDEIAQSVAIMAVKYAGMTEDQYKEVMAAFDKVSEGVSAKAAIVRAQAEAESAQQQ